MLIERKLPEFSQYLIKSRGLSRRAASNYASRAARVEHVMGENLSVLLKKGGLEKTLAHFDDKVTVERRVKSDMRTAIRAYYDFLKS